MDGKVCSNHGSCVLKPVFADSSAGTECKCEAGFLGTNCELDCPLNPDNKQVCSGKGQCVRSDGGAKCACEAGFVGASCSGGCAIGKNTLVCSGHGKCSFMDSKEGTCECEHGWIGNACDSRICGAVNAFFNPVTNECVCPVGDQCCEPQKVHLAAAKEKQIRELELENAKLSKTLEETMERMRSAQMK